MTVVQRVEGAQETAGLVVIRVPGRSVPEQDT